MSLHGIVQGLVAFVEGAPLLAALLAFTAAAAESVAVVGMIVPGSVILIGLGGLAGLGNLDIWPLLIASTLGAIAGDGISYWLGHRYKRQICGFWPLSRKPELIDRAEAFFKRHGAMSVAIARFLPALRSLVPVAAGTFGMSPLRFYVVNALSALAWAPAHIIPAAFAGRAFAGMGEEGERMAAIVVAVIAFAMGFAWLGGMALVAGIRRLRRLQIRLHDWSEPRTTALRRVVFVLTAPDHADLRLLVAFYGLIAAAAGTFALLANALPAGRALARIDAGVARLAESLRVPEADSAMVAISSLGDMAVTMIVAGAAMIWLARVGRPLMSIGLGATVAAAWVSAALLRTLLSVPHPDFLQADDRILSFPSSHAAASLVLYGLIAWLLLRRRRPIRPPGVLPGLVLLVAAIALSRIYLGSQWTSDILGGYLVGFFLIGAYGVVFLTSDVPKAPPRFGVGIATLAAVAVVAYVAASYSGHAADHAAGTGLVVRIGGVPLP